MITVVWFGITYALSAETYALIVSGLMSLWFALAFGLAWALTSGSGDNGCTTAQTGDENLCLDGG